MALGTHHFALQKLRDKTTMRIMPRQTTIVPISPNTPVPLRPNFRTRIYVVTVQISERHIRVLHPTPRTTLNLKSPQHPLPRSTTTTVLTRHYTILRHSPDVTTRYWTKFCVPRGASAEGPPRSSRSGGVRPPTSAAYKRGRGRGVRPPAHTYIHVCIGVTKACHIHRRWCLPLAKGLVNPFTEGTNWC
jgi:hypothetical protein